jgi:hypothetical protein
MMGSATADGKHDDCRPPFDCASGLAGWGAGVNQEIMGKFGIVIVVLQGNFEHSKYKKHLCIISRSTYLGAEMMMLL